MTNDKGYVYILTNPSFRDDWVKIGKSSRSVDIRSKELDNTAVPLPFEIYATAKTVKYNELDLTLHHLIDQLTDLRIRQNREFFNISPSMALQILKEGARLLDDVEIVQYKDGKPITPESNEKEVYRIRFPFKFPMCNIEIGETITFIPTGIDVVVATENKVEYEDRLWTLSAFVGSFLPEEQQNNSGAYQGPKYFSYKSKPLDILRKELEK